MKQAALYFCAMLLGLLLSGPVAADMLATAGDSGRPLKAAAHAFDPERPYWEKAIPDEKMPH